MNYDYQYYLYCTIDLYKRMQSPRIKVLKVRGYKIKKINLTKNIRYFRKRQIKFKNKYINLGNSGRICYCICKRKKYC